MSHEVKIHQAQTLILRELLFRPEAGYSELQKPTQLGSDHFNFHISRLVELEFVEKVSRGSYRLTPRGKEYANRLDTDENTVERQPKTAVLLAVERQRGKRQEFLFQQRLKNPYYGFWGLPSGKVRWGEKIAETAARELMEEAGLEADWRTAGVYHEIVTHQETKELIEDKIFFVCHGTNPKGELVADFEGGHNEWLTRKEAENKEKIFDSFAIELDILDSKQWLYERTPVYDTENF